jgi:hypothetical protein
MEFSRLWPVAPEVGMRRHSRGRVKPSPLALPCDWAPSGCHHKVSLFRVLALGIMLAYPRLPERSQRH